MAAACDPFLAATDVADYLVEKGVPFREAHHLTGGLVRRCLERGEDLAQVPLEELRALSPAFDEGYYALHEPAAQLARKRSRGGSAPRACASSSSGPRARARCAGAAPAAARSDRRRRVLAPQCRLAGTGRAPCTPGRQLV